MESRRSKTIKKIEVKKDEAIKQLTHKHALKYEAIKNYYSEITNTNLDLIRQLKDDLALAKADDNKEKKLLRQEEQKNAEIKDPYEKALAEIEVLRKKAIKHEKIKEELSRVQLNIADTVK